jgi:hypothetical protein
MGTQANQAIQSKGLGAKEAVRRNPESIARSVFFVDMELISKSFRVYRNADLVSKWIGAGVNAGLQPAREE